LDTALNKELSNFIALRFLTIDSLVNFILNCFRFQSSKHDFKAQKDLRSKKLTRRNDYFSLTRL
jgi:hypothetical protein